MADFQDVHSECSHVFDRITPTHAPANAGLVLMGRSYSFNKHTFSSDSLQSLMTFVNLSSDSAARLPEFKSEPYLSLVQWQWRGF